MKPFFGNAFLTRTLGAGLLTSCVLVAVAAFASDSATVSGISAVYRNGQTFVAWKDAAQGATDADYRYTLYRSASPITEKNLDSAKAVISGIMFNSGKLPGRDFFLADRLNPAEPMSVLREGTASLPLWSGVAVYTAKAHESAYYAVVATDTSGRRLSEIVPGRNATMTGVQEDVAPILPIEQHPAKSPPGNTSGMPLVLKLHATESRGTIAEAGGDYYLYFGNQQMGYRDGLPGIFSVERDPYTGTKGLELYPVDPIVKPDGNGPFTTAWFGYNCVPQWNANQPPAAYPFTENRLVWMIGWTLKHYHADVARVYSTGYSLGGWGSTTFALRHPEIFAAIYAMMPRPRQREVQDLASGSSIKKATMPDGTDYLRRMDMVKFVRDYRGELPTYFSSIGRQDGYALWSDQVDMAKAMAASHRGFAFAWNNGHHGDGIKPMALLMSQYPLTRFRTNLSYPAFSRSSLDADLGNGDPASGDLEGGINLGFAWTDPSDNADSWTIRISNTMATHPMTVDVTPRRAQRFHLAPGTAVKWSSSTGGQGVEKADQGGVVTIPNVMIHPRQQTTLTLSKT